MKVAFAVFVFAVLLWLAYGRVQDARTIASLSEKQKQTPETSSFELQSRCADAASKAFKRSGYTPSDHADYTNHFNEKLQRCFVLITSSDWKTNPGTVAFAKSVYDAVEGKQYGEYLWISDKVKKAWEVAPVLCDGTAIDGSYKKCSSEGEFTSLMSDYMDVSR